MKHFFTIRFLFLFAVMLAAFSAVAQTPFTVSWVFTSNTLAPTSTSGLVSGSNANKGLGGPASFAGASSRLETSGWPTATSRSASIYTVFCVMANSGQTIPSGTALTFSFDQSQPGVGESSMSTEQIDMMDIEIRVGGPSSYIWSNEPVSLSSTNNYTFNTTAAATSVCFRIYGYSATTTGDVWRFDNVSISGSTVLPITLTEFKGAPDAGGVKLSWKTSAEIQNDYMAVERSADARNFREIGRVKGAGDSNEEHRYELIDEQPQPGVNYYRLRQVDFDGTATYSNMVVVKTGRGSGRLTLSPNPAAAALHIGVSEAAAEESRYQVFDAAGRLALEGVFPAESTFEAVDVAALPAGFYTLRLTDGSNATAEKFYKQ